MIFPDTPPGTSFPKIAPAIKPNIPPINNDHKNSASPFLLYPYFSLLFYALFRRTQNMRQETPEKEVVTKVFSLFP